MGGMTATRFWRGWEELWLLCQQVTEVQGEGETRLDGAQKPGGPRARVGFTQDMDHTSGQGEVILKGVKHLFQTEMKPCQQVLDARTQLSQPGLKQAQEGKPVHFERSHCGGVVSGGHEARVM